MNTQLSQFKKHFDWRTLVIFIPGILYLIIFTFYPMVKMFVMSFYDWQIGYQQTSPFIGFENYVHVLTDPVAWIAIENTFIYLIVTVPLQICIGLGVALLINQIKKLTILYRVFYYLPVITSWVVVALLFKYIFSNEGLFNYLLLDVLHLTTQKVGFLSTRFSALSVAMILGIWKGIGWNMIIFLAALQAVPKDYYEAADIDGANAFHKFFKITLPLIRGTFVFALVMLTIGAFNTYTPIAVLTEGNPYHQTEVVLTWLHFQTFSALNFGYGAALSMILTLTIVVITIVMMKTITRKD